MLEKQTIRKFDTSPYHLLLKDAREVRLHRIRDRGESTCAICSFKPVSDIVEEGKGDASPETFFGHAEVRDALAHLVVEVMANSMNSYNKIRKG